MPLPPDAAGIIRSGVFPGLWLDTPALVKLNRKRLYATLRRVMATSQFAEFAAQVARYAPAEE